MRVTYLVSFLLEPISFLLILIAIVLYLHTYGNQFRYKVLATYYLLGLITLVFTLYAKPNIYLYGYMYLLTGVGVSLYFFFLLGSNKKSWLMLLSGLITILYYLYERFLVGGNLLFPSIGYVIVSICIILNVFVYFYELMTHVNEESLLRNFDFWFVCSQLMYHLGAFAIFLTYNKLTLKILPTELYSNENRALLTYLWGGHNILLFVSSLIIWVGVLWIVYKNKSQNSNQTVASKNRS